MNSREVFHLLHMIDLGEKLDIIKERENSMNPEDFRYNIVRFYNGNNYMSSGKRRVLQRDVSYEVAKAHCNNPESSSATCTKSYNKARTRKEGYWFDGFERA